MNSSENDSTVRTITDLGLSEAEAEHGCACSSGGQPCGGSTPKTGAASEEYRVTGMTCSHCVATVIEEVSAVSGVGSVSVELVVGGESLVTVTSAEPGNTVAPDAAAVREAIVGAGYGIAI